jgi:AraC-like DNA-binding protein
LPLSIGISAGIPVTEKNGFFENAIAEANHLCTIGTDKIVVSKEVNDLFESEDIENQLDSTSFKILQHSEKIFVEKLIAFTEKHFENDTFQSSDFHTPLGFSKSQFYRKMIEILGKSPLLFLKDFRLNKSLYLLVSTEKNISEIAFLVGFKSQSQYSKSFQKHFGTSPTTFRETVGAT